MNDECYNFIKKGFTFVQEKGNILWVMHHAYILYMMPSFFFFLWIKTPSFHMFQNAIFIPLKQNIRHILCIY